VKWADSAERQDRCVAALVEKCNILWAMLDSISHSFAEPPLLLLSAEHLTGQSRPSLTRKARLIRDTIDNCWMLIYPERGLQLNDSASSILRLCDGKSTLDEIVDTLCLAHRGVTRVTMFKDVRSLLLQLAQRSLIAIRE